MKYKLLVLDLDGTLTNSKKEITAHTLDTLTRAQEQGLKIVLASGRPTYGVAPLANKLQLEKYEGYILSYNGGEIIDWKTKEMMYKNLLDPTVLPYLYKCAKDNDFAIVTYENEFVLTENNMSYRKMLNAELAARSLELNPVLEIGNPIQICELVRSSRLLSFLPDFITEEYVKSGQLNRLNVTDCPVKVWTQLLIHKNKWRSAALNAFIDFYKEVIH